MGKTRILSFIFMLVGVMMVLAACGGGDDSAGGGDGDNGDGGDGGAKGAKIAIGPPASETNTISQVILSAHGLEEGDYQEYQEGFGDAADLVQDGNIDISVGELGLPAGSIECLEVATVDILMLDLSKKVIDEI